MKKIILVLVLLASLLICSCGRQVSQRALFAGNSSADKGIAYNSSVMYLEEQVSPISARETLDYYGETTTGRTRQASASQISMSDSVISDSMDHFATNPNVFERKLVKRAFIRIRVENLEASDEAINYLLEKYNGYTASTNIDENNRYYSLRVPASYYEVFLSEMNGMGRLLGRHESTEDVTLRYYDLEGRLESKRDLLRTFQSYLTRARTMEEILSVEARIADLQRDIESTGTQLRYLANMVEYSTIDLNLFGPVMSVQNPNITFSERVKQLFGGFGNFLSTAVVIILGFIIYGIPTLALLTLLFWVLFGNIGLARKLWGIINTKRN